MSDIHYYRAAAAHIELVTDLRLDALAIFQGPQPPEQVAALRPVLRDTLRQGIESESYICWLASIDGIAAGAGGLVNYWKPGNFLNPGGRTGYIMSMYTNPEYRGRGICSELVRRLIRSGNYLGIRQFELHATRQGEPVYQKLGFKLHDEPSYRMITAEHGF